MLFCVPFVSMLHFLPLIVYLEWTNRSVFLSAFVSASLLINQRKIILKKLSNYFKSEKTKVGFKMNLN